MACSRQEWLHISSENQGTGGLQCGLFPCVEYSPRINGPAGLVFGRYSCASGGHLSIPRILFFPRHIPRDEFPSLNTITLRLHFHIIIPGEIPVRWQAATRFDGTFPIYGLLRRFWGRALRIRGVVVFSGERPARLRHVEAELHQTRVQARLRRAGLLRMAPLRAEASARIGPRLDCLLLAVSLTWYGESSSQDADEAFEPEACSVGDLALPLRSRHAQRRGDDKEDRRDEPQGPPGTSPTAGRCREV